MKTIIENDTFKRILNATKRSVAAIGDMSRPALRYIRLEIKSDKIVAYSCDGYQAARIEIQQENAEEFTVLFPPFNFKASSKSAGGVEIETDGNVAFIEFDTEYGRMRYCFNQTNINWNLNIENIFTEARPHDREIGFDASKMKQAFAAIQDTTTDDRHNLCIIETKENAVKPIIIRAKGDKYVCEQLILPVRTA